MYSSGNLNFLPNHNSKQKEMFFTFTAIDFRSLSILEWRSRKCVNFLGFRYRTWVLKFQWRNLSLPSPIFSFTVLYHNSKVFPLTSSSLGTQTICQLTYWQNFSGLPDIWGPNEGILIFLSIIISFRISLLEVNPLIGCHTSLTINGTATYGPSVTKVLLKKKNIEEKTEIDTGFFEFLWKNHDAHWASLSIVFQFRSFYFLASYRSSSLSKMASNLTCYPLITLKTWSTNLLSTNLYLESWFAKFFFFSRLNWWYSLPMPFLALTKASTQIIPLLNSNIAQHLKQMQLFSTLPDWQIFCPDITWRSTCLPWKYFSSPNS